jgi:hypothetical protein
MGRQSNKTRGNVSECLFIVFVFALGCLATQSRLARCLLIQTNSQAIRLGQQFRQDMYPDSPGGGILRLHSTFRHDLKIKTSDEGRVMKTGAAFAKGLLELEGEIPPILVSLVHKEKGRYVDPRDCSLIRRRRTFDSPLSSI